MMEKQSKKGVLKKDETAQEEETEETVQKEISLIKAQVERDELRDTRDKPEILKQRETDLVEREVALGKREFNVAEKEAAEEDLAIRENQFTSERKDFKAESEGIRNNLVAKHNRLEKAATEIIHYVTMAKNRNTMNYEREIGDDDLVNLINLLIEVKDLRRI